MGHPLYLMGSQFRIKAKNLVPGYNLLADFGKSQANLNSVRWLRSGLDSVKAGDLCGLLEQLGWRALLELSPGPTQGDIIGLEFINENLGDETTWFNVLAPVVEPKSWLQVELGGGTEWERWCFPGRGLGVVCQVGSVEFSPFPWRAKKKPIDVTPIRRVIEMAAKVYPPVHNLVIGEASAALTRMERRLKR